MGIKDGIKRAAKEYGRGARMVADDVHRIVGTERGKQLDEDVKFRQKLKEKEELAGMLGVSEKDDTFKQYSRGGMVSTKGNGKAMRTKKCKMM
jgi:hypothetical protein